MNKSVNIQRGNSAYSTFGGTRCNFHSLDFGQLSPVMCDEILERDRWHVNMKNSLEIAPLAVKTRNDVFYNQAAFFVGCSQLDKDFVNIRTKKVKHLGSTVPHLLTFSYSNMLSEILSEMVWSWNSSALKITSVVHRPDPYNRGLLEDFGTGAVFDVSSGYTSRDALMSSIKKHLASNGKDINVVITLMDNGLMKYIAVPFTYTKKGQALRKVFDGLGYKMPIIMFDHISSSNPLPATWANQIIQFHGDDCPAGATEFTSLYGSPHCIYANAYPILSYVKIVNDYFVMSSVQDENPISLFLDGVYNRNPSYVSAHSDTSLVNDAQLLQALLQVSLQLHSDDITRMTRNIYDNHNPFYTNQNENVEPYLQVASPYDSTQPGSLMRSSTSSTIPFGAVTNYGKTDSSIGVVVQDNNAYNYYTNKLLDATHRMLLTAKFAGSRAASRLRAFFGVTDPIDDAMHCIKVAENTMPLQVDGVLINSNTYNGTDVDDDAGTKIATANGGGRTQFTFSSNRAYGYGIVLNWLSVRTVYANRTPRYCLKTHTMDLYDGIYDGQGFSQAVPQMEVNTENTDPSRNFCFGNEPLFEDYRSLSVDFMSGDVYRVKGLRSYLIPRDFRNIVNEGELYAEFSAVRSVRQSTDEFGDMWIAKDGYDPILVFQDVNVMATRNVQDSVHALGIPSGDANIEIEHNMA